MDEETSFSAFCHLCERLGGGGKRDAKLQILQEYINEWRRMDPNLYPLARLLLPQLDRERPNYGLKESRLADYLIAALGISRDSHEASTLRGWERLAAVKSGQKDFAQIVYQTAQPRICPDGSDAEHLSIARANDLLTELADAPGDQKKDSFQKLVMAAAATSAAELRWLIRIILKSMRFASLSTNAILQIIHPDAPGFWNVCTDLRKLCRTLTDPSQRFDEAGFEVSLFDPIVPMLAERQSIQAAFDHRLSSKSKGDDSLEDGSGIVAEPKIDGERIQLHTDGKATWRYWSRRGVEYTHLYGAGRDEGSLTCHIACGLGDGVSVVLDGEMIGFDPQKGAHVPFGTLKTIAIGSTDRKEKGEDHTSNGQHPCFIVFDILFHNGKSLLRLPLWERRRILEALIPAPIGNHLKVIPQYRRIANAEQVASLLDQILADRGEGLVLKDPASTYHPGRRSPAWTKVKPDYLDALCDDIDVLVLGGSHGRGLGRQPTALANFCCGVYDVAKSTADKPHYSFLCRLGSGFGQEELDGLSMRLVDGGSFVPYRRPPEGFDVPLLLPDRPDFVLGRVEDGLVFQVKAHALQRSVETSSGWTLRFPRFVRQRPDKDYRGVTSTAELEQIYRSSHGTMARSSVIEHLGKKDTTIPTKRSGTTLLRGRMAKARVDEQFQASVPPQTERMPSSALPLSGRQYWVLYGDEVSEKSDLEQMIRGLGGEVIQGPPRTAVITGKRDGPRVGNLRAQGTIDLITPEWVRGCVAAGALLPYRSAAHVIHLSRATQESLRDVIDQYGDEYARDVTSTDELTALLNDEGLPWRGTPDPSKLVDEINNRYGIKGTILNKDCQL